MIVTLQSNSDYLKRIKEVVADVNQGITQPELDAASRSAEDDVMIALNKMGYDTTAFTTTANTPHNIIELIKLIASARIWARMLLMYRNDLPFEDSFGAGLLKMANEMSEKIANNGALRLQNGTILNPGLGGAKGGGAPKFWNKKLGIGLNPQIVTDSSIANNINTYGPSDDQYQIDPGLKV